MKKLPFFSQIRPFTRSFQAKIAFSAVVTWVCRPYVWPLAHTCRPVAGPMQGRRPSACGTAFGLWPPCGPYVGLFQWNWAWLVAFSSENGALFALFFPFVLLFTQFGTVEQLLQLLLVAFHSLSGQIWHT